MTKQRLVNLADVLVAGSTKPARVLRGQTIASAEPEYSDAEIVWTQEKFEAALNLLDRAIQRASSVRVR